MRTRPLTGSRLPRPALLATCLVLVLVASACQFFGGSRQSPPVSPSSSPVAQATATATPSATPKATVRPSPTRLPTPTPTATPTATPTPLPSAGATDNTSAVRPCPGKEQKPHAVGRRTTGDSENWSGYSAISTSTSFTCVEAVWTHPKVTCHGHATQLVAFWVGIGGFDQRPLEQIGTGIDCIDGVANSYAWHESLPRQVPAVTAPLEVRAGDRLWAQVRSLGSSRYLLSIVNLTTGATFSVKDTNKTLVPDSAEWIAEAPTAGCPSKCHTATMPDFGTVTFSQAWVTERGSRRRFDATGFTHERESMTTSGGKVRAGVSFTAADGSSFRVTWHRA